MISSILRRPLLRADKGLLGGLQPYLRLRYPHLGREWLQPSPILRLLFLSKGAHLHLGHPSLWLSNPLECGWISCQLNHKFVLHNTTQNSVQADFSSRRWWPPLAPSLRRMMPALHGSLLVGCFLIIYLLIICLANIFACYRCASFSSSSLPPTTLDRYSTSGFALPQVQFAHLLSCNPV